MARLQLRHGREDLTHVLLERTVGESRVWLRCQLAKLRVPAGGAA